MKRNEDILRGKRPRACNAEFCMCKWLLFHMRRENSKLR